MLTGERGFTLIGLLFLVAGLGVGMAALGTVWQTAAQREKEKELLFAGTAYRRAIASYWRASPGLPRLPATLDELLLDPRFPHVVRHLRRRYADPMTGGPEWGLVRDAAGGIVGVYSLSERRPLKAAGFASELAAFEDAGSYRDWVFLFQPDAAAGGPG
ncbi:MAG: type II secretion system protein [Gallionellaceae bacterium]|nr:type II secretion system protein [Gallionellaceae bacterium]